MGPSERLSWIVEVLRDGAAIRTALARHADAIAKCVDVVAASIRAGGKLLVLGNGGSAADAQHIAAELVGRFTVDRKPLPAIALTVDTSAITAIANDYGYDHVFDRQVRALGRPGDVVLAISTSGRSESVLRAVRAAREGGMKVVGLTGAKGEAFAKECDACVLVPTAETARIQELHITVGHVFCALLEAELTGVALMQPAVAPRRDSKHVSLAEMLAIRDALRAQKRTLVWTNGCFDILHAGHVASLRAAKALGDVLVVGVNDDAYVKKTKGEGRPIHALDQRIAMLSALEMVDFVLPFAEPTPAAVLTVLQPDIHCKGADYAPPNGAPIPEAEVVRAYGGRIAFLPLVDGLSTTSIASRLTD